MGIGKDIRNWWGKPAIPEDKPIRRYKLILTADERYCPHCRRHQLTSRFHRRGANNPALQSWCKDCQREAINRRHEYKRQLASYQVEVELPDGRITHGEPYEENR